MILIKHDYGKDALLGKTVLITGGGGGIGFEASRAFSYMGAKVIIAEVDADKGERAQAYINSEFGNGNVDFFQIDLADEMQIDALVAYVIEKYDRLDVIINNAAVVPMGAVEEVSIADWDMSYAVNLRAPVLLTQKFLPTLKQTGGVIAFNPSNPGAYMSAYEIFKSAQVELCNALDVELAGAGVITYGVAPGFVKTDTCMKAVQVVADSMGMTADDFFATAAGLTTDAETAGVGYAVSVLNAERYRGQITFSQQVLVDAGLLDNVPREVSAPPSAGDTDKLLPLLSEIIAIFNEQYNGWKKKNMFHRQFILGDFKKQIGLPADVFKRQLDNLYAEVQNGRWDKLAAKEVFVKLQGLYAHQRDMLESFEKDPVQLASDTALLNAWIDTLQEIITLQ